MIDPCCFACRTPSGICLTAFTCAHHREAEAQDEANARARRTHSDPTADAAIRAAMATRNPKRRARPKYPKED